MIASVVSHNIRIKLLPSKHIVTSALKMSSASGEILRSIFLEAVQSVQPAQLFDQRLVRYDADAEVLHLGKPADNSSINSHRIDLSAGKRCHLVGFGKAVFGMALETERMLAGRLVSGLISVPMGTLSTYGHQMASGTVLEVCEGAHSNLPDKAAAKTAQRILERAAEMTADDVLIVLISGGGSALLTLPAEPITIAEKRWLCSQLAARQATISELNTVRSVLSQTKGGRLAVAARNASALVTLVISDVCGDALEVIASGPTMLTAETCSLTSNAEAVKVLRKFGLLAEVPVSVTKVLYGVSAAASVAAAAVAKESLLVAGGGVDGGFTKRTELIIGSNAIACEAARKKCERLRLRPLVVSHGVEGDVGELAEAYAALAEVLCAARQSPEREKLEQQQLMQQLGQCAEVLSISTATTDRLHALLLGGDLAEDICIIAGGEPTVRVHGHGIGGRNQELALRVSQLLEARRLDGVWWLSAGTDGIDGPTDAAGALGAARVATLAADRFGGRSGVKRFVENNDSWTFFRELCGGEFHVRTGHTGTNVMDVHLMLVEGGGKG